jgi:hypothetical protein
MRHILPQAKRSVSKHRLRRFCCLVVSISLLGCSGNSKPDAAAVGKAIGQNVTEFAQGVGSGVDTQLQVAIELSPELIKAGLSHTIAKQKGSLDDMQKAISIYLLAAQALNCTLTAKAYNADNQEVGRATSDVQFVQDDAQYIAFTFPPDMDRQTVKVYKITAKFPETESSQQ